MYIIGMKFFDKNGDKTYSFHSYKREGKYLQQGWEIILSIPEDSQFEISSTIGKNYGESVIRVPNREGWLNFSQALAEKVVEIVEEDNFLKITVWTSWIEATNTLANRKKEGMTTPDKFEQAVEMMQQCIEYLNTAITPKSLSVFIDKLKNVIDWDDCGRSASQSIPIQ